MMSTSIESLRREKHVFHHSYANLCSLKNLQRPSINAKTLDSLEIDADYITLDEWSPILICLERDQSLSSISLRCRFQCSDILEDIDDEVKCSRVNKRPLIFTRYVLMHVMDALSSCMRDTDKLTCLKLNGILLDVEYLDGLCRGLEVCTSLRMLSFKNCGIRDEGVSLLCSALQDKSNVSKIDLSQCGLTGKGAKAMAQLVAHQKELRSNRGWTSERGYGEEWFLGLKRITFNHNVYIGDGGCKSVMDVLKEDDWLKALDFQNCGLTDASAVRALEMLDKNSTIAVVDMRSNQISVCLLKQITLGIRSLTSPDCDWLAVEKWVRPKQPSPFPSSKRSGPVTDLGRSVCGSTSSYRGSSTNTSVASFDTRSPAISSASTLKGISEMPSCYSHNNQREFDHPEQPRRNVLEEDVDSVCESMGDTDMSSFLSEDDARSRNHEIQIELEMIKQLRATAELLNDESAASVAELRSRVGQERGLRVAIDEKKQRLSDFIDTLLEMMPPQEKQSFLAASKNDACNKNKTKGGE